MITGFNISAVPTTKGIEQIIWLIAIFSETDGEDRLSFEVKEYDVVPSTRVINPILRLDCIHLAQDRDQWRWGSVKGEKFFD
jgi:hypothetical protein